MDLKFSLGLHTKNSSKEDHFDLFLETSSNKLLLNFYYEIDNHFHSKKIKLNNLFCKKISSEKWIRGDLHSKKYLNYTGFLSENKGYLEHLIIGKYYCHNFSKLQNNNIECMFSKSESSFILVLK